MRSLRSVHSRSAPPQRGSRLRRSILSQPPYHFPPDNPLTEAKAKLGEMLFFDPRLLGVNYISSATCHKPSFGAVTDFRAVMA